MAASIPVVNVKADKVATYPFGTEFEVVYSVDGDGGHSDSKWACILCHSFQVAHASVAE